MPRGHPKVRDWAGELADSSSSHSNPHRTNWTVACHFSKLQIQTNQLSEHKKSSSTC